MAYIINRFGGAQLTAVEDGTIDQTTDLKLVGKNYSGYGEIQNENFVFLLENFSGSTPPTKALDGQVWYDSGTTKLKFWTGTQWKNAGGAEVAPTEPAGLDEGDLWWNTQTNQLYGKTEQNEFVLIGPQAAGDGTTQLLSTIVLDDLGSNHAVIIAIINDEPVYMISDDHFTPANDGDQSADLQPFLIKTNFPYVAKGLTLIKTPGDEDALGTGTAGITQTDSDAENTFYWGTASNAKLFDGNPTSNFVLNTGSTYDFPKDGGIRIGDSLPLKIYIENIDKGVIENNQGDEIRFKATSTATNETIAKIMHNTVSGSGFFPAADDTYALGSTTLKWNNVHATTFTGQATAANTLAVPGIGNQAASAPKTSTAYAIVARDENGDVWGRKFQGTATSAQYADLAEKYTTDKEYPVGTAMCVGGDAETTACGSSCLAIGVISDAPAYLMNSECDGQAIGLKGRVPVRVSGAVKKGQAVYAWQDGICSTVATTALVGVALESSDDEAEKLIECVLKV